MFCHITVEAILSVPVESSALDRYVYTVKGRVVDENRNPVSGAIISIKSPRFQEGDLVDTSTSDGQGLFTIECFSDRPIWSWTLYISDYSAVSSGANFPLDFHMGKVLSDRCCKTLRGHRITPAPGRVTNIGDVKVTDRQFSVVLDMFDTTGKQFAQPLDSSPWLTIRDADGDIVAEGGYNAARNNLALPSGKWLLELTDLDGSKFFGQKLVEVNPTGPNAPAMIEVTATVAPQYTGRRNFTFADSQRAKKEIKSLGWKTTKSEFKSRAAAGNYRVVSLFLTAGFDPDVLTYSEAILTNAISHPQLLKIFLEAGANPNRTIRDKITPIHYACGWLIIPKETVKMLLDAGANPYLKEREGRDCFMLADEREEIITVLREHKGKNP